MLMLVRLLLLLLIRLLLTLLLLLLPPASVAAAAASPAVLAPAAASRGVQLLLLGVQLLVLVRLLIHLLLLLRVSWSVAAGGRALAAMLRLVRRLAVAGLLPAATAGSCGGRGYGRVLSVAIAGSSSRGRAGAAAAIARAAAAPAWRGWAAAVAAAGLCCRRWLLLWFLLLLVPAAAVLIAAAPLPCSDSGGAVSLLHSTARSAAPARPGRLTLALPGVSVAHWSARAVLCCPAAPQTDEPCRSTRSMCRRGLAESGRVGEVAIMLAAMALRRPRRTGSGSRRGVPLARDAKGANEKGRTFAPAHSPNYDWRCQRSTAASSCERQLTTH